jgi:DNA end-binding protein Ku
MAPRSNWKGFLRLSLVTCPVALYPATSESEKISFNQLNRQTGHRIKYLKVDADTGDEVLNEDIVKGYQFEKDQFIEVTKEELEDIALESTRTIEIDEFVDKSDIDPRYLIRPYYIRPDGKVGHDAFAVIRETIREMDKVAIGRVVLTNREHIIALEPMDKGLVGTLLRYPYEVRSEAEYFDEIQDVNVTKDMLDLAKHIVNQKAGRFAPEKFEDHYVSAEECSRARSAADAAGEAPSGSDNGRQGHALRRLSGRNQRARRRISRHDAASHRSDRCRGAEGRLRAAQPQRQGRRQLDGREEAERVRRQSLIVQAARAGSTLTPRRKLFRRLAAGVSSEASRGCPPSSM